MGSEITSVTLQKSKRLVEDFRKEKGLNFSEALRFIIEDYFRIISRLDQARRADFDKVLDLVAGKGADEFNHAVIDDLNDIKGSMQEIRNMLLVVGNADDRFREGFIKYFPKYFKDKQE